MPSWPPTRYLIFEASIEKRAIEAVSLNKAADQPAGCRRQSYRRQQWIILKNHLCHTNLIPH